jgi:RHS repeat-associated protein
MPVITKFSYDALDRLVSSKPIGEAPIHSFYNRDHLCTEQQGRRSFSVFRSTDNLHAQQKVEDDCKCIALLATDLQRSILIEIDGTRYEPFAYSPYGYRHPVVVMNSLLAFNGEPPNDVTGHYLLGNGRRAFNPVLMRFNSPDRLSPFGRGGLNAFAYCKGDPINFNDPSGQFFQAIMYALKTVRYVLKIGWESYALALRPRGTGLGGVATLVSRTGYGTAAVGWGIETSGYEVGARVASLGGGLIATGQVLKVTDKLVSEVKSGKLAESVRYRVRQLRRQGEPAVRDLELGNIPSEQNR